MRKNISFISMLNITVITTSILICIFYGTLYFAKRDYLMAISSIIVIFLPFVVYLLEKIIKRNIPDVIKSSYLVFLLLSAVLGAIANLYTTAVYYDKIVHFLSGVVLALVLTIILKHFEFKTKYKKLLIILSTTIFNAAIAAFWEICEFSFDLIFKKGVQRGLTDTMTDMISAIVGGIIISVILISQLAEKKESFRVKKLAKK